MIDTLKTQKNTQQQTMQSTLGNVKQLLQDIDTVQKQEANESLFDKMMNWEGAHEDNLNSYYDDKMLVNKARNNIMSRYKEYVVADMENPESHSNAAEFYNSLYEISSRVDKFEEVSKFNYEEQREKIGLDFDFMQGQEASNEEKYDTQTLKLGLGEVSAKDTDSNGKISINEYVLDELKTLPEDAKDEDIHNAIAYATLMFSVMDEGMGNSDKSGDLSAKEFASFYENMDRFDGEELQEGKDGVINIDAASEFPTYLIENIFSEETINAVLQSEDKEMFNEVKEMLNH